MVLVLGLATVAYVWAFGLRRWSGGAPRIVRFLPELIVLVALLSLLGMLVGQLRAAQDVLAAKAELRVGAKMPDDLTDLGVWIAQLSVTIGLLSMLAAHGALVALTQIASSRRGKPTEEEAPPEE